MNAGFPCGVHVSGGPSTHRSTLPIHTVHLVPLVVTLPIHTVHVVPLVVTLHAVIQPHNTHTQLSLSACSKQETQLTARNSPATLPASPPLENLQNHMHTQVKTDPQEKRWRWWRHQTWKSWHHPPHHPPPALLQQQNGKQVGMAWTYPPSSYCSPGWLPRAGVGSWTRGDRRQSNPVWGTGLDPPHCPAWGRTVTIPAQRRPNLGSSHP